MNRKVKIATAVILPLLALVGCASVPTAPSVMALPGSARSFDEFRFDDMQCRQYASQQIGTAPNDPAVNSAIIGTAVGALAGVAIGGQQGAGIGAGTGLIFGSAVGSGNAQNANYGSQRQYDNAYIQCMYAKGHKVPVPAGYARSYEQARPEGQSAYVPPPPPPGYISPARPR